MHWRKTTRRALLTIFLVVAPLAASDKLQPRDHVTVLTTDGRVFHGLVGSASSESQLVVEFRSERVLASTAIPYKNIQSILPSAPPITAIFEPPPPLPAALPDQQIPGRSVIPSGIMDGPAKAAGKQKRQCCCQCRIRSTKNNCSNGNAGR